MSEDLTAVIDELWQAFRPAAVDRVDVIETYLARLDTGVDDPVQRAAAASAAHKLAGALGSYLRPGSPEAADLEDLLRGGDPVGPAQLSPLVRVLRTAVDR